MSLNPDVLASCVEAVRSRRLSIDECVAAYPDFATDLRAILEVVSSIGPPPPVAMDSVARSRGRGALIAAMAKDKSVVPWSSGVSYLGSRLVALLVPKNFNQRMDRLPALMIALVSVATIILGGGVVAASANALPGDALYPVKLGVENVQLAAAPGDQAKAQFSLRQAAGRLEEIDRADQAGRTDAITTAATDYVQEVADANQHLANAVASGQDVHAAASELSGELARQSKELAVAEGRAPASARLALAAAARAARSGINVNGNATGSPGAASSETIPEVATLTPTIGPGETSGPRSTVTRAPEGGRSDAGGQSGTDDKRTPEAIVTSRPSVEPPETRTSAATRRSGADGSNADDQQTPTSDSSTPVLVTPTPRPTHEPEATNKPRPTRAAQAGDDPRATRTPTPTEAAHGPLKSTRVPPGPRSTETSASPGGDQTGGGD